MTETVILGSVAAMMILAAAYDVATLTIPNWLTILLAGFFPVAAVLSGLDISDLGWHLATGFAALLAGILVFSAGLAGGGDAKLFAAGALYMGTATIGAFVMAVALAGGALVMAMLLLRRLPLPVSVVTLPWVARLYQKGMGVPYGVAIAAGALLVLPKTHLAAALAGS
ncbi:MAG TPA: peptidase [Alphaproteobacteria bacterium]|nr:peptidase [Alphaproteobacteria bacterium]HAJ47013.1 peptidase [Alphaproteobacteria bacterium]